MAVAAFLAAATTVLVDVPSAVAQARPVLVAVVTSPARPDASAAFTARATIDGCPPGGVRAELFRDGSLGVDSLLVARTDGVSGAFWRANVSLTLAVPLPGWYGVRVVCGNFSPDREPMPNTRFLVDPGGSFEATAGAAVASRGAIVAVSGAGCQGPTVEYQLAPADSVGPFSPQGEVPVGIDGTWSGEVPIPPDARTGANVIRLRCIAGTAFGEQGPVDYPVTPPVDVS